MPGSEPGAALGLSRASVGAVSGVPFTGLSTFVGRAGELTDLPPLVSGARLVTLTGPAGVGKTRLAGEVAWTGGAATQMLVRWATVLVRVQPSGMPTLVRAPIAVTSRKNGA